MHLWGQKPICPNRADYGHDIQYDIGSFLKNKFLSFEERVSRSIMKSIWSHFEDNALLILKRKNLKSILD